MSDSHKGSWQDTPRAAIAIAIMETRLLDGEYLTAEYGDGSMRLVPVDPAGHWEFAIEVAWSEVREQYRATISRLPHVREDA